MSDTIKKNFCVGIDLGGTNIAVGLCDEDLEILDKDSVPTWAKRPPEQIVSDMAHLTEKILARNGLTAQDISHVGIAAPGSVNGRTGTIEYANNLPFLDFPICKVFRSCLPVDRVYAANDANAAALAEAVVGAAKGAPVSMLITLGTGIGGGIVMNGKIYDGSVNCAGAELGHTVIVSRGRQCSCGRRGCWEAYASATALATMTREKIFELQTKGIPSLLTDKGDDKAVSARTVFDAMRAGDRYAKEIVDEYIFYLAEGITNMINIFQPDILSLGGGISNERAYLTDPLTAIVERDQYTRKNAKKTRIVIAQLGNDAGIIGAAALVE